MTARSTTPSTTKPTPPAKQREDLLDSERNANRKEPRNFKEDALTEKIVSVEPDGTGPTPTETFDPEQDRKGDSNLDRRQAGKTGKA